MRGSAVIIGGGIGGLAAARMLGDAGWEVTLHEREPGLSGTGTALGIWPSALRALDRIGIGAQVRAIGTAQRTARFQRADGTTVGTLDADRIARRTGDAVRLLSRPALLDQLYAAASVASQKPTLRFGDPVEDLPALRRAYDLVVAADGIFGRTRVDLFGEAYRARYAGMTAWRGWLENRPTDMLVETWGPAAKFGVTPQEGGRTNWYAAAVAAERDHSPGSELVRLKERFGDWGEPVRSVLDGVTEDGILRHDLYVVPPLPSYVQSTVALIGDSAHAMTPDLGRGACEALVDAVALADCVRDASTVEEGLRAYDRMRRRPTQRLARASAAASRLTRWTRGLWFRDRLLGLSLLVPPPA